MRPRRKARVLGLHPDEGVPMKALLHQTTPEQRGRWSCARVTSVVVVLLVGSTGASWSQVKDWQYSDSDQHCGRDGSIECHPCRSGRCQSGPSRRRGSKTRIDSKAGFVMEDKTNLTMGPSSTLKLDRFVYAGPKKAGTIVLNLAQGTCRLVIGDANKRSYTIVTPTAAIGVRG